MTKSMSESAFRDLQALVTSAGGEPGAIMGHPSSDKPTFHLSHHVTPCHTICFHICQTLAKYSYYFLLVCGDLPGCVEGCLHIFVPGCRKTSILIKPLDQSGRVPTQIPVSV